VAATAADDELTVSLAHPPSIYIALLLILSSMTLVGCGTIATTAAVGQTAAAFGLAVTSMAVDGAVLVGKGVAWSRRARLLSMR